MSDFRSPTLFILLGRQNKFVYICIFKTISFNMQKYPVGIQSFPEIIEGKYTYIDKTQFIGNLINEGKYYFLSRPRRFGKSLLLSTIHAFFEGRRNLFQGLSIDKMDMEWSHYPVLHLDFNSENFKNDDGVDLILDTLLRRMEDIYGRNSLDISPSQRFNTLIYNAFRSTGKKVVILIDEYDKPLLGIEESPELFEKNQAILKAFFGNLKSMDSYIRFAFMTGVARFNKVNIFSDINNLDDISLSNKYADLCGWTEKELLDKFHSGITDLSKVRGESFEETLTILRSYYDGYLFAPKGNRLYNPYSVLKALRNEEIRPYWFETGTPTFLAKRVKRYGINPASLNGETINENDLMAVGLGLDNPVPLMFQTGYLTIDSFDPTRRRYQLRFPNEDVETGFSEFLLPLYVPQTREHDSPFNLKLFQDDLYDGHPENFMKRLATLLKDLTGEDHHESTYRAAVYLLCKLSGTEPQAERHSYKGRSDLEVTTPDYIYIFEFKYNRSVKEAINQIHDRDYSGRHALDHRRIYLIGANFSENKNSRSLDYTIETAGKS